MLADNKYIEHPVFERLITYSQFYDHLSFSIMHFMSMGTHSIINLDTYVYTSMQGTLESIREIILKGRINDAYALLRKYYDAAIINIYTNLYLSDHISLENFIVAKIENWRSGEEQLPEIREMNNYIQKSEKVLEIYNLLHKDKRYTELRDRCNNHTHYNYYYNVLLNDPHMFLEKRISFLDKFLKDLENVLVLHLAYLFYLNDHYMMSSYYVDCLDCGLTPEPDSQYLVAPFVQEIFDTVIKKNRYDLFLAIKNRSSMQLE